MVMVITEWLMSGTSGRLPGCALLFTLLETLGLRWSESGLAQTGVS